MVPPDTTHECSFPIGLGVPAPAASCRLLLGWGFEGREVFLVTAYVAGLVAMLVMVVLLVWFALSVFAHLSAVVG